MIHHKVLVSLLLFLPVVSLSDQRERSFSVDYESDIRELGHTLARTSHRVNREFQTFSSAYATKKLKNGMNSFASRAERFSRDMDSHPIDPDTVSAGVRELLNEAINVQDGIRKDPEFANRGVPGWEDVLVLIDQIQDKILRQPTSRFNDAPGPSSFELRSLIRDLNKGVATILTRCLRYAREENGLRYTRLFSDRLRELDDNFRDISQDRYRLARAISRLLDEGERAKREIEYLRLPVGLEDEWRELFSLVRKLEAEAAGE
jgi:hypothetical protein